MLITCKECQAQISDKAVMCPHCGLPLKPHVRRFRAHKRLPNGFGSVTKLKRNLRKPYLARVTNNKDDFGRPVLKSLGYYKTYNEAYSVLVEYNKNPYDLSNLLTVADTYEGFKREVFSNEHHTKNYSRAVERAFEQSADVHDMPIRTIRPRHIKLLLDQISTAHAKANLKNFWNRLFDYALSSELVDRNYAREFNLDPKTAEETHIYRRAHLTFSDEEMSTLWKNKQDEIVQMMLIQCYSGWRPGELCELEVQNINLKDLYYTGGNKTEAGIGRVVPIHSAVRPLVSEQYDEAIKAGRKTLYELKYQQYYYAMKRVIKRLGLNPDHRPHDPRKQFVTMALKAGADPMAVKVMVGHKISDITEKTYTERDIEWLRSDIEKIDASVYK